MSEPRQVDPQGALEYLFKMAPAYAQAKAERIYLEEFRKSKKSILMGAHKDLPIGGQEREAYSHPEYIGLLAALQVAVEREETLRWRLEANRAAIEVWRSQEASNRNMDRAAQ